MKRTQCKVNDSNKGSALCDAQKCSERDKINGILYLPAIGLIASAIFGFLNCIYFISAVWYALKHVGAIYFFSLGAVLILLVTYILTLIAAWLFFHRSRWTRQVMIVYYLLMLGLALYLSMIPVSYFGQQLDSYDINMLITAVTSAVIWIPYFLFSKRINLVFYK